MSIRNNLGDLRAAIEDTMLVVMHESGNGIAPSDVVLSRLKSERRHLLDFCRPQLEDIALTKLLNEVCQRRTRLQANSEQGDLFGGFGSIPKRVTLERGLKKDTVHLTLNEARGWLARHDKRIVENDNKDFQKLVDTCARYSTTGDETLGQLLDRIKDDK